VLVASVLKRNRKPAYDVFLHPRRNAQATRLSKRLQPSRNIHAVSENVAAFSDDIADVNADSEVDPFVMRHIGISFSHAALNLDGTAYSINGTGKLHQHSVPGGLDNTPAVLSNIWIYKGASMGFELAQSASLVSPH
jgi:hypothetical protein